MENIGVILPSVQWSGNFIKNFLKRYKYDTFPVTEYGFNFVVARDNQNCSRIFNKNGVHNIVVLTDLEVECCDFNIIKGDRIFCRMLPEYVRKTAKIRGGSCSVTLVDKELSDAAMTLADKLCDVCGTLCISTRNFSRGEMLCERLLDKYGIIVTLIPRGEVVSTDIAVVLEDWGSRYTYGCTVVDKNCREPKGCRLVNDFYIPFRIKPPFGMSNLVFGECVEAIGTKIIDIR